MHNDKKGIIYLATPYSHDDPKVKQERIDAVNKAAAHMMQQGLFVYSPISHTDPIANDNELPTDWQYWGDYCETMLKVCSKMVVLMQEDWEKSEGVNAEIKIARKLGIPIEYRAPWEIKNFENKGLKYLNKVRSVAERGIDPEIREDVSYKIEKKRNILTYTVEVILR